MLNLQEIIAWVSKGKERHGFVLIVFSALLKLTQSYLKMLLKQALPLKRRKVAHAYFVP